MRSRNILFILISTRFLKSLQLNILGIITSGNIKVQKCQPVLVSVILFSCVYQIDKFIDPSPLMLVLYEIYKFLKIATDEHQ